MTPTTGSDRPPAEDDDDTRAAAEAASFAEALAEFDRAQAPKPSRATAPAKARADDSPPRVGTRVSGRVVSVHGDTVLLDIGGRSEAVADASEFRSADGTLSIEVGQVLELHVLEAAEQVVLARSVRRSSKGSLDTLRQARAADLPVRGKVAAVNSGGLTVELDGVRAFCPLSQMETSYVEDPAQFVGQVLEFLVTEIDESRARVVVSRRKLLQRVQAERARERLAALAPGQELDGTVVRMEPFGAFVDLGGIEGLVHISEVSHTRLAHPRELLAQGEQVRVKVLRVEPGRDGRPRVALSIRAARPLPGMGAPDPWATAVQRFSPGTRVQGVVARLADFGAFVNLAPGIDGLVHVSQVSERRIGHVREVLAPGQAVEAVVLAVEPEKRRMSLSIREALAEPIERSRVSPVRDEPAPAGPESGETRPAGPAAAAGAEGPPPGPVEEPLTPMQLAFRRAREEAERRSVK